MNHTFRVRSLVKEVPGGTGTPTSLQESGDVWTTRVSPRTCVVLHVLPSSQTSPQMEGRSGRVPPVDDTGHEP